MANTQQNDQPRNVILRDAHLWQGERYGPSVPGDDGKLQPVTVPADFPSVLKGLDAPEHKKGGNPLDVNSGGPPANSSRSSDTADEPREEALGERTTLDGQEVPPGLTGDNLNHAVTGLHTVTHPEQPASGSGWRPTGASSVRAPIGAGLPDSNPSLVSTAESTGAKGGKSAAAPKGNTGLSREALEEMTVDDLKDLAKEREVTVTRSEGEGEPLKADYVKALAKR